MVRGKVIAWDPARRIGKLQADGSEDVLTFSDADLVEDATPSVGAEARFLRPGGASGNSASRVRLAVPFNATPSPPGPQHVIVTDIQVSFSTVFVIVLKVALASLLLSAAAAAALGALKLLFR